MTKHFLFLSLLVESGLVAKASSSCGPIPAVCYPITLNTVGGGVGIHYVELSQINNTSTGSPGLQDFTCTDSTWLTPGVTYNFMAITGQTYEESVRAWIDYNNDGNFDPSELIFGDSAIVYGHVGSVTIPSIVLHYFIPLRMRVGSDVTTTPTGCNNLDYGQYEDYTIYFGPGTGLAEPAVNQVSISPNPFYSVALITIPDPIPAAGLKIYDAMGSLVYFTEVNNGKAQINRDGLSNGLYYFVVEGRNEKISSGKMVIQ